MLGLAGGAAHDVPGAARLAGAAANAAETVPRAPVHEPARVREHGSLRPRLAPADGAQIDEGAEAGRQQRQRIVGGADIDGEHRPLGQHAQKRPRPGRHAQPDRDFAGDIHRLRPPLLHSGHQIAVAPHRHQQALGIIEPGGDPLRILAPLRRAVERRGGIDIGTGGEDQGQRIGPVEVRRRWHGRTRPTMRRKRACGQLTRDYILSQQRRFAWPMRLRPPGSWASLSTIGDRRCPWWTRWRRACPCRPSTRWPRWWPRMIPRSRTAWCPAPPSPAAATAPAA